MSAPLHPGQTTCPDCGSDNVALTSDGATAICVCRECGKVWRAA